MKKKVISLLLSLTMLTGIITGCGVAQNQSAADILDEQGVTEIPASDAPESTEEAAPVEAKELDLSNQVDLVFYVMGDAPQDEEEVEALLSSAIVAINAIPTALGEYKAAKKAELAQYKPASLYRDEEKAELNSILNSAYSSIDACGDKDSVDYVVINAKNYILKKENKML